MASGLEAYKMEMGRLARPEDIGGDIHFRASFEYVNR